MAATVTKLGPGTVSIGEVGSEVDFSCQVIGAVVEASADQDDPTTVLCGDVIPGALTITYTFSGTVLQDLADDAGLVAFTWENPGATVPLTFVPSTEAGKQVTGDVTVIPLSIGGDEAGANATSDFEWSFVGDAVLGDVPTSPLATGARRRKTGEDDAA